MSLIWCQSMRYTYGIPHLRWRFQLHDATKCPSILPMPWKFQHTSELLARLLQLCCANSTSELATYRPTWSRFSVKCFWLSDNRNFGTTFHVLNWWNAWRGQTLRTFNVFCRGCRRHQRGQTLNPWRYQSYQKMVCLKSVLDCFWDLGCRLRGIFI